MSTIATLRRGQTTEWGTGHHHYQQKRSTRPRQTLSVDTYEGSTADSESTVGIGSRNTLEMESCPWSLSRHKPGESSCRASWGHDRSTGQTSCRQCRSTSCGKKNLYKWFSEVFNSLWFALIVSIFTSLDSVIHHVLCIILYLSCLLSLKFIYKNQTNFILCVKLHVVYTII